MCKLIFYVLLLATGIVYVSLQSCQKLFNVELNYRNVDKDNVYWNYVVHTGCVSDAGFKNRTVVRIWFLSGSLPILSKNFISNMTNLKEIVIEKYQVETIEPGAFSNLPQLRYMNIQGNPIKTIPSGVFDKLPSLKMIDIFLNKVTTIEDHAFANLPNLNQISLNRNNIKEMRKEWFTNTTNIEIFDAWSNSLRKIPSGMFHGWTKIKGIYLNSNSISIIEGELFKDNPSLISYVGLHRNSLRSISASTFGDTVYMGQLTLSANLLNYLPEDFLQKVKVGNIDLYGNPFSCVCWEKNRKILLERDVTIDDADYTLGACKVEGVPVCGFPSNSSDTCVEAVDKDLTRRFLSYLKKIEYDTVTYPATGQQCAMFDELD